MRERFIFCSTIPLIQICIICKWKRQNTGYVVDSKITVSHYKNKKMLRRSTESPCDSNDINTTVCVSGSC